jgi:hypothetical protein
MERTEEVLLRSHEVLASADEALQRARLEKFPSMFDWSTVGHFGCATAITGTSSLVIFVWTSSRTSS